MFRCELCKYSTTTKGNLSIHMQSDKHLHAVQDLPNSIGMNYCAIFFRKITILLFQPQQLHFHVHQPLDHQFLMATLHLSASFADHIQPMILKKFSSMLRK